MLSLAIQGHLSHLYSDAHQKGSVSVRIRSAVPTHYVWNSEELCTTLQVQIQSKQCIAQTHLACPFCRREEEKEFMLIHINMQQDPMIHISPNSIGCTSTAINTITHCSFLIHILLFLLQQSTTPFFLLPLFIQPVVFPFIFSLLAPLHLVLSPEVQELSFSGFIPKNCAFLSKNSVHLLCYSFLPFYSSPFPPL